MISLIKIYGNVCSSENATIVKVAGTCKYRVLVTRKTRQTTAFLVTTETDTSVSFTVKCIMVVLFSKITQMFQIFRTFLLIYVKNEFHFHKGIHHLVNQIWKQFKENCNNTKSVIAIVKFNQGSSCNVNLVKLFKSIKNIFLNYLSLNKR